MNQSYLPHQVASLWEKEEEQTQFAHFVASQATQWTCATGNTAVHRISSLRTPFQCTARSRVKSLVQWRQEVSTQRDEVLSTVSRQVFT